LTLCRSQGREECKAHSSHGAGHSPSIPDDDPSDREALIIPDMLPFIPELHPILDPEVRDAGTSVQDLRSPPLPWR
jgi:hypothetical protein